ncbi:2784_t:CDS:1, partial [Acaulospora colombiana]
TVILIWNKEMVDQFSNADLRHSEAPISVSASFEKDETRAESVTDALEKAPKGDRLSILQEYLLGSAKVDSNLLGKCKNRSKQRQKSLLTLYSDSRMHIKAVQWFGIESEEARCMAHK